jgi:tetratricopeptide (TPR) repeat protein
MDALISGVAGRALLLERDSLTSLDVVDPSRRTVRHPSDLQFLFGDATDLRVIEDSDIDSITRELQRASNSECSLDLTLIALDPELSDEIRKEAIEDLEGLLADSLVLRNVESILYGHPFPESADISGAIRLCAIVKGPKARSMYQRLQDHQPSIREVLQSWEAIPTKLFGEAGLRTQFQNQLVREGLFRALALTRETQATVGSFLVNAGLNTSIQALPNYREVLQRWAVPFREPTHILDIRDETDEEGPTESLSQKGRRSRRKGIDRAAVLRNVESQKDLIIESMKSRDLVRVRTFVKELVKYQLKNGEPVFAAKSLCDLACEAKALGMFSLQLELAEESTRVRPDDAWSWGQYADALLRTGRASEALSAYEQATAFGGDYVIRSGRADTLKALGRFREAIEAYERVIDDYPQSVVARNGRAESLKALGQLQRALEAYDAIIADHPEDLFARNGRAGILVALGRLRDALDAYERVIADYPQSVVARNGRADTLKRLGRLAESLDGYDSVIADHIEDAFTRNGRAETLKALGRLHEALEAYDAIIIDYPENVIPRTGRAESLKALGQLQRALEAYDAIIADYPEDLFARNGRAGTLKAFGRLSEALDAYEAIIIDYPDDSVARCGRAETLKTLGRLREALEAYDAIIAKYPENIIASSGRAESLKALGLLQEALEAYDAIVINQPEDVIVRCGRADTLKALGRLREALETYDGIVLDYPHSVVARNGRSCVLGALQRYDEALADLSLDDPTALQDWTGYQIRGMIMLGKGYVDEAVRILQRGVAENPLPLGKEYSRTALAVAQMRQGHFGAAGEILNQVEAQELRPQVSVLRTHCFGKEDQTAMASAALDSLSTKPWSISDELIEELHRRYILKLAPVRNDEWVFDQEIGSILVVANQQAPISNYLS